MSKTNLIIILIILFCYLEYLMPIKISSSLIVSCLVISLCSFKLKIHNKTIIFWLVLLLFYFCMSSVFGVYANMHSINSFLGFGLCTIPIICINLHKNNSGLLLLYIANIAMIHTIVTNIEFICPEYFNNIIYPFVSSFGNTYSNKEIWDGAGFTGITNQSGINSYFITLGLSVLVSKFVVNKNLFVKNKINILLLIISVIALFLTQKRMPLFANVLATTALLLVRPNSIIRNFKSMLYVIISCFLFILLLSIVMPQSLDVFARINSNGVALSIRGYLWLFAFKVFLEYPVFGIGFSRYSELLYKETGENLGCHNTYLQILCETGLVGFIIFSVFICISLYHTYRMKKKVDSYNNDENKLPIYWSLYFQIYYLVYSLTGNTIKDSFILIMYFTSIALALSMNKYLFGSK